MTRRSANSTAGSGNRAALCRTETTALRQTATLAIPFSIR